MKLQGQFTQQNIIPVILGGNIGAYGIARAFHEAYHINSIIISTVPTGPVQNSAIVLNVIEPKMKEFNVTKDKLVELGETTSKIPKLLIGSDDWHVELIIQLRKDLNEEWIIPYISHDLFKTLTDKFSFYKLCDELEIDYPKTIDIDMSKYTGIPDIPFNYPVIVKPSNSIEYQSFEFLTKKKVYIAYNETELRTIFQNVYQARYTGILLIQEFIPGEDTAMHVLTCYSSTNKEMKLASMGRTLIEDHTPGGIGNPLAILTVRNLEIIKQAKKLLNHVGYIGFSNFDIKYDCRDGTYKFFELNARLGRSNYYVTGQGHNIAKYYVEDFIKKKPLDFSTGLEEILFTLIPKHLLLKNLKGDESLTKKVNALYTKQKVRHPLQYYPSDNGIKRRFYEFTSTMNYYLKFKKYPNT
ncbi:TPA: carbamoyl phosphate synthase-like protein [Bacillus thuringiensis]|nr:carbamoyl phosphate synthase-like protein [Bacillus thuringiensis]